VGCNFDYPGVWVITFGLPEAVSLLGLGETLWV
jgi:hypothetical protein